MGNCLRGPEFPENAPFFWEKWAKILERADLHKVSYSIKTCKKMFRKYYSSVNIISEGYGKLQLRQKINILRGLRIRTRFY